VEKSTLNDNLECTLGRVVIHVMSPLVASGSVTTVTCSLFSIIENSQFKVPRNSNMITKTLRAESLVSALGSVLDIGGSLAHGDIANAATKALSTVTKKNKHTKRDVENYASSKAMPTNFIGDVLDVVEPLTSMLGMFGLDNPTIPTESGRYIVKANGSMNYAHGPEYVEKLAIAPSSMALCSAETFASVIDEMEMPYLLSRYSYFGRFDIFTDTPVAALLFSVPLSPYPTLKNTVTSSVVKVGDVVQSKVLFPLLSYLGIPFRYWTGGIRYKLIVSASMMHTCKLFCAFNYGMIGNPPDTLLNASSQYGVAIEITQGSNEYEFTVPYVSVTPYMDVFSGVVTPENTMGQLNIYLMNQLIGPSSVAGKISILAFIAGGADFTYEMIGGYSNMVPFNGKPGSTYDVVSENLAARSTYDLSAFSDRVFVAESGVTAAPTNTATSVTDVAIHDDQEEVAPPQLETNVDDHFGITHLTVREYLKRYQLVSANSLQSLFDVSENYSIFSTEFRIDELLRLCSRTTDFTPSGYTNGMIGWTAGMFRQFKGAMRWKIVFENNQGVTNFQSALVVYIPGNIPAGSVPISNQIVADWVANAFGSTPFGVTQGDQKMTQQTTSKCMILNGSVSNVIEFETPYSSKYLSVLTRTDVDNGLVKPFSELGRILVYGCGETPPRINVFLAIADEARFGNLFRVPRVCISGTTKGTGTSLLTYNVGYGQYPVPTTSRIFRAESGVQRLSQSSLKVIMRKKVLNFVRRNQGCTREEVTRFSEGWLKNIGVRSRSWYIPYIRRYLTEVNGKIYPRAPVMRRQKETWCVSQRPNPSSSTRGLSAVREEDIQDQDRVEEVAKVSRMEQNEEWGGRGFVPTSSWDA